MAALLGRAALVGAATGALGFTATTVAGIHDQQAVEKLECLRVGDGGHNQADAQQSR
jgi:hypothetical protein